MPGIQELLIIAVIILLIFGTSRLRNLGGDLGSAIKGFKSAMSDDKSEEKSEDAGKEGADKAQLTADEPAPVKTTSEQVDTKKD